LIIHDDEIVGIADFLTPPPHHDQHSPAVMIATFAQ
jgi:hypothetical protein